MANVMSMRNLKNKVSRNGFDLSERRAFTAKVGELLPCFVLETIPGDSISINPSHFTRTMPINTAAYSRLREYVHFYYVPYRLLHCQSDVFFSDNQDNPTRSASIKGGQKVSTMLPYFTFQDILKYLLTIKKHSCKTVTGFSAVDTSVKLLEYLGYGDFSEAVKNESLESLAIDTYYNLRLNPFTLLAYQKIYQDHFRNQQWERSSPFTSNIDYMEFGSKLPLDELTKDLKKDQLLNDMFTMRYCDFNKDYFFGLLPNAQYGDESTFSVKLDGKNLGLQEFPNSAEYDKYRIKIPNLSASILALRKAEALQKYKEIKQSGNHDYKTFLQKIFGVSVSDDRSDICRYLGGYNADINISEVVNTALNTDDSVVDIKGKGISSSGAKTIDFDAREFGVIIGIYTCRPTLDYALDAPLKANTRISLEDYANPVFDKIGMQTINLDELILPYSSGKNSLLAPNSSRKPLGYAPRYVDYKTSYDKVFGEFKNTLGAWVTPLKSSDFFNKMVKLPYVSESNNSTGNLDLSEWEQTNNIGIPWQSLNDGCRLIGNVPDEVMRDIITDEFYPYVVLESINVPSSPEKLFPYSFYKELMSNPFLGVSDSTYEGVVLSDYNKVGVFLIKKSFIDFYNERFTDVTHRELYDYYTSLQNELNKPARKNEYQAGELKMTYATFKVSPSIVDSIFVQSADDKTSSDQLLVNMSLGCPVVRNLDYDGLPY